MYLKILIEILSNIDFGQEHVRRFSDYFHSILDDTDDKQQTGRLEQFAREYYNKTSITWFTYNSAFVLRLNHAFRTMDINFILLMGF